MIQKKSPSVAILMCSYNGEDFLEEQLDSIQHQDYKNWILYVNDDGSKDNTLKIAESISLNDRRVNVKIQEPQGIYEAMNLALTQVKGSYIWFMNAGDTFASNDVLEHALMTILQTGASLVIGGYKLSDDTRGKSFRFRNKKISRLRFAFNLRMSHQSMIFKADAFEKIGEFNLKFRLASDFDFILKYMKDNTARTTDKIYSIFRPGGAADQNIEQVHREKHISRKENFPNWIISPASSIWTNSAKAKILLRKIFK